MLFVLNQTVSPLALLVCAVSLPFAVRAQSPQPTSSFTSTAPAAAVSPAAPSTAAALAPITNTATRTDRRTDDVPATVTVLPAQAIEATGARDLKDLFRTQVDLSVRTGPTRFGAALGTTGRAGNEGLNIRGLEGNQVLMLVDGIRVPASFSFGALSTGRGDYLALEATQAAEVLRGPASTSFGSDGLAGAISLRTLDPADVLRPGASIGGFVRLGATQVDDSAVLTAAVAQRAGAWQALLLASQRQGSETKNQGRNTALDRSRSAPNPLDYHHRVVLAKLLWDATATQRLGLTLEATQRQLDVDVISGRAALPGTTPAPTTSPTPRLPATAVIGLQSQDRIERQRVSLEHRFDDLNAKLFQKAETRLYVQSAQTQQFSAEDRNTAADRTRFGRYRERVVGLSTQAQTSLTGAVSQRLSVGVDASRTHISAVRDGTPNPSGPPPFGEAFPAKPFPDTDYTLAGAFVQSEIQLGPDGNVTLIPGLRWDHYKLQPSASGYTGDIVGLSDQAFTPRLGAVWRISPALAPYAQWARGFRAPAPGQVNNGFTNVASGYRSIGNPGLQPEAANSLEVGLRGQAGKWSWQVAAYDNRYSNFISQEVVAGAGTAADPTIFQFTNLARARIRGLEARAEWRFAPGWQINAASAVARGTSQRQNVEQPLNSVDPARTALGLRYSAGTWSVNADLLRAQGKSAGRIAATQPEAYAPAGYTVLDVGARWQPAPGWTLLAQLHNALDATYTPWADVRGLAANSAVIDAYTAPGRHLQLALRHDF